MPSAAARSNCSPRRPGCTEAIMLAHGFTADFLVNLICARMATTWTERVVAGGGAMEAAHRQENVVQPG
jgi:hypothetical protein